MERIYMTREIIYLHLEHHWETGNIYKEYENLVNYLTFDVINRRHGSSNKLSKRIMRIQDLLSSVRCKLDSNLYCNKPMDYNPDPYIDLCSFYYRTIENDNEYIKILKKLNEREFQWKKYPKNIRRLEYELFPIIEEQYNKLIENIKNLKKIEKYEIDDTLKLLEKVRFILNEKIKPNLEIIDDDFDE